MSRIRGIEVKVQKEVLQTRKYGLNEILKKKNEEQSSDSKDDVEKNQISELLYKLPKLDKIFEVHRKIGEGTFSSVYLGSLRQHASLPSSEKRWFAIKHLVPTAHPARVEHELRCLQDMGGKDHVIGVDLCLRHLDTIVFIMPYIPHRKFSEYVGEMDADEVRRYMRALLTALRHVHSFGVIHRDVKPSNFLYDRENRRYLLVDFGLAQRLVPEESHTPRPASPPPPAHHHTRGKRLREEESSPPAAKRAALDLSVSTRTRAHDPPSAPPASRAPAAPPAPTAPPARLVVPKSAPGAGAASACGGCRGAGCAACACWCRGRGGVCAACLARGGARAARAGTQGYRPPEVLLKVAAQGTAVDVWAAGVVLCSALTARYPFLRAPDDVAALAELADLLGTRALSRAARAHGRALRASAYTRPLCLRKLALRVRGAYTPPAVTAPTPHCARCRMPRQVCLCRDDDDAANAETFDPDLTVAGFPDSAFALAATLLQPDPRLRISAEQALQHPFLRD